MTDKEITKLRKSSASNTHNISIPANMVLDSAFPFTADESIIVELVKTEKYFETKEPKHNYLIIKRNQE